MCLFLFFRPNGSITYLSRLPRPKIISDHQHWGLGSSSGCGVTRAARIDYKIPHLSVAETWGPVRRCLPSQQAGSPVQAHLQTGAVASAAGRSAAAPWTAGTEQPGALGAEGSRGSGGPCCKAHSSHLTKEPLPAREPDIDLA